jgi:hypothetical protein
VKSYEFKTKTSAELAKWIKAITHCIGKNKNHLIPKIDQFWKFRLISASEFEVKADTSDILLFTGDQMGAKLQRLVTRSRFGRFLQSLIRPCSPCA